MQHNDPSVIDEKTGKRRSIVMWCHGTLEKNWKDSGWVYKGVFYPCEYTDDPNGQDKVIGRSLCEQEILDRRLSCS
jgi:hypothetical protein